MNLTSFLLLFNHNSRGYGPFRPGGRRPWNEVLFQYILQLWVTISDTGEKVLSHINFAFCRGRHLACDYHLCCYWKRNIYYIFIGVSRGCSKPFFTNFRRFSLNIFPFSTIKILREEAWAPFAPPAPRPLDTPLVSVRPQINIVSILAYAQLYQ